MPRQRITTFLLTIGLLAAAGPLGADSAGGLEWTPPPAWETAPPRPMRAATYVVPAALGDSEPGECAVFYFGLGQGGSVQDNLDRWTAQFEPPEPVADLDVKLEDLKIRGVFITMIDVTGTFLWKPRPAAPQAVPKPGYRLLGAIAEGPEGLVFFKLTAPAATAAAAREPFLDMLRSVRPLQE